MKPIDDHQNDRPILPGAPMKQARMAEDNDDEFPTGAGGGSRDDAKKKGGMGTGAIIGIVAGVLVLCCCLSCCGGIGFRWDEFKTQFDAEMKKQQQQKK
jgi:hypothetical protein